MTDPHMALADPSVPAPYRVADRIGELDEVTSLRLEPIGDEAGDARPGQFHMLYAFGIGEAAISVSAIGDPGKGCWHTIRDVGKVSHALANLSVGSELGLRGPFGTGWPLEEAEGRDVVIVAGGLGLAPLRPAIQAILADRERFGRLAILIGCRTPADILYLQDIRNWRSGWTSNST